MVHRSGLWDHEDKKLWGFPYLKRKKLVGYTTFPFHIFDRYEIHIQTVVDSIYAFFNHFPILIFTHLYKERYTRKSKNETNSAYDFQKVPKTVQFPDSQI